MSKAKDPAVLWYYRDYLSGTEEMAWAEQGAYARLLNKQADKGHLSLASIQKILKKDFHTLWPAIEDKFKIDEDGLYYNERMDIEVRKRSKNSQAQRDRINKYWEEQRKNGGNTTEYSTVDAVVQSTEYSTEIPIANANANKESKEGVVDFHQTGIVPDMLNTFKTFFPGYPPDVQRDFQACMSIALKIADMRGWPRAEAIDSKRTDTVAQWETIVAFAANDRWFKTRSITDLNNEWQRLIQSMGGALKDSAKKDPPAPVQNLIQNRTNSVLDQFNN